MLVKKILISDFDQTFYRNEIEVYNNVNLINYFKENKENLFVIATGRSYEEFKKVANKFNLTYDYVLFNNGANIMNNNDEIINSIFIDNNVLKDLIDNYLTNNNDIDFSYTCSNKLESRVLSRKNVNRVGVYFKDDINSATEKNKLLHKYNELEITTGRRSPMIEITSNLINKSTAIDILVNLENLSDYKIYAIGDGDNDVEMIKNYSGVTLKNGTDEVKKVAKNVYNSLEEYIKTII